MAVDLEGHRGVLHLGLHRHRAGVHRHLHLLVGVGLQRQRLVVQLRRVGFLASMGRLHARGRDLVPRVREAVGSACQSGNVADQAVREWAYLTVTTVHRWAWAVQHSVKQPSCLPQLEAQMCSAGMQVWSLQAWGEPLPQSAEAVRLVLRDDSAAQSECLQCARLAACVRCPTT